MAVKGYYRKELFNAAHSKYGVPLADAETLSHYLTRNQKHVGNFLTAILTNNLLRVYHNSDEKRRATVWNILQFLEHEAPVAAWGSQTKLVNWVDQMHESK